MKNDGKNSEESVRLALKGMQGKRKCQFNRLYDTTSARGSLIPPQLADFCGTFEGVSWAIEVKSSTEHTSFTTIHKGALREAQVALMRLHIRAGGLGFYIFHNVPRDTWEIWDCENILQWFITPKGPRAPMADLISSCQGKIALQRTLQEALLWLPCTK